MYRTLQGVMVFVWAVVVSCRGPQYPLNVGKYLEFTKLSEEVKVLSCFIGSAVTRRVFEVGHSFKRCSLDLKRYAVFYLLSPFPWSY